MREKLLGIIVCVMLIMTIVGMTVPNFNIEASPGEGGDEGDTKLDFQYIKNITESLSKVIYNPEVYGQNELKKGRSFGSKGEHYAATNILQDEMINLSLYNPDLDPPYQEQIENIKSRFDKIEPSVNLTNNLETMSFGITINDEVNETSTTLTEFHIEPMWNWRAFLAFCEKFLSPNIEEIIEELETVFKINMSDCLVYNNILNESWLTKNVTYENLSLIPRPLNLSWLVDFFKDQIENISCNESIVDYPSFMNYFLPAFQEYYNFTFTDLNTSVASEKFDWFNIQWRPQTIGEDENFLYIAEDPAFNPNSTDEYWLSEIIDLFENTPILKWFAPLLKTFRYQIETLLYNATLPKCKGLLLYDFNDDMYNMQNGVFRALPTLYINGSIGKEINSSLNDYNLSFWINQSWAEDIESYNVIGQINGTDQNKTVIVDCLYDCWWNQGTGDAAIGMGIVLGVAKYFKDHNITPKYNLKFIGFSGEEQGLRGACYYESKHWDENVITIIDVNQVGFSHDGPPLTLDLILSNESIYNIVCEIANLTQYDDRLNDGTNLSVINVSEWEVPSDYTPFYDNRSGSCNSICFLKDMSWIHHHRDGNDHEDGDAFKYYYGKDVNLTGELIFNVTKYFCVNPDCWIDSYSALAFDSNEDNGTLNDSINITFSLKTILPNDLVRVKVELKKTFSINEIVDNCTVDYVINSIDGVQDSIILAVPENAIADFYTLRFYLFNSTGRINDIVDIGLPWSRYNDSKWKIFHLNSYNENVVAPYFYDVGCSSQCIGSGLSNTVSGCVSSAVNSMINQTQTYVLYPDGTFDGYNMTNIESENYELQFENTWQNGEHQYCVWAIDENDNSSISDWYSFNVSIEANIGVCTLLDEYGNDQYINITDPPNPLDNYTLVDRGFSWNKYYDAVSGNNVLETYTSPVNYQEENGVWMPINCSLQQLETNHPAFNYGYRVGNDQGLYNVYFKSNTLYNWPVVFAYNKSDDPTSCVVRSKLVGIGYLDPDSGWAYEFLQNVQSSQGQLDDNKITYDDVFTGVDVSWSYENMNLKEEITLSNTTKSLLQSHPPSLYGLQNDSSYLVFVTKLDYQNLILFNESGDLTGNVTVSDGWIGFKDTVSGDLKCALPLGDAYELYNDSVREKLVYRFLQYNGGYYLLSGLKIEDLNNMVFPVVIDPTLSVFSSDNDGYIYNSNSNYSTAWSSVDGDVSDGDSFISVGQSKVSSFPPDYRIRRGFLFFDTSELPSNAYIENATLSLYKYSDYSTTDFVITVQNGQPDYPDNPLEESDYYKYYYSGNGGELNTINFVNGCNNITVTETSWINIEGVTKLCLRSNRDINCTAPDGNEYVNVYSSDYEGEQNPNPRPKLIIVYRNQSKIKNSGSFNISGYLLMQVQYKDSDEWIVDHNTVDETSPRVIGVGQQLALDTIFNGFVNTNDLGHGSGLYRVYAVFRDPEGNVLQCDDDSLLEASYEFTIDI